MRWVLPPVIGLVAIGLAGSLATGDAGSATFVAGFGVVLVVMMVLGPAIVDRGRRSNAPVTTERDDLVRRDVRVPIGRIAQWDVVRSTMRTQSHGSVTTTTAHFDLAEGGPVRWTFVGLREDEADELRQRLAAVIETPPGLTPR